MGKELQFILYNLPDGEGSVQAYIENETIWLTQKAISKLFGVGIPAISKHIKNIFAEGELDEKVVVSKMEITTEHGAIEGKTQAHEVCFYNLDVIISVGYRELTLRKLRNFASGLQKFSMNLFAKGSFSMTTD